jgi:NAD(P)-dependent dehydrogenase (short-subunit alcohol dehydrogenase family)
VVDENTSVHDFPHLAGRTVVVTGANSGIGLAAALALARAGAEVGLVARDQARLDKALSLVRAAAAPHGTTVTAYRADFTVLGEVRELAARLRDAYQRIDVLANNAGGAFAGRTTTVDGHELTIQVNHLAPFLLTNLLVDRLAGGRVINTASEAHRIGRLDPAHLNSDGLYLMFPVYGTSKQANILFTTEAARRWPEISSFSYHPGVVRTGFGSSRWIVGTFYRFAPGLKSPGQGADTLVWLADEPISSLDSGGYYVNRRLSAAAASATRPALASALWTASEAATDG